MTLQRGMATKLVDVIYVAMVIPTLNVDMCLTKNNRLMNGWKIVGSAFTASVKPLVQHGRASSKEFHSWTSHLQADLKTAVRKISLGARPSKNRKGGSGTSAGVEVYTAEC